MKKSIVIPSLTSVLTLLAFSAVHAADTGGAAAKPAAGKPAKLPFVIYSDKGSSSNHYAASGSMGNMKAAKVDDGCRSNPHSGTTCIRIEYKDDGDWAGVAWQDPANDWGTAPGGWNLTGAKKLVFWARGDKGGEIAGFKFGILESDKKYPDSATGGLDGVELTTEWKEYSIDLTGKDLSCLKTGFVWTVVGQGKPVVFFLDDIRFE